MVEEKCFEPYEGEPDKERLLAAYRREPVDRVPNIEVLIEDKHVEKILGKYAGNTIAYGGDPAKGVVDQKYIRPMYPNDFIDLCNIIGQDIMIFEGGTWTPFKKEDINGELTLVVDRSIKTRKDFETLTLDSKTVIDYDVKYIREYKETLKKRNSKIGVAVLYGCIMQTLYEWIVGMNDFMVMCYEDRGLVEDMMEVSTEHFIELTKTIVKEGVDFVFPADDVAFKTGLFLPPKLFKEIWIPRMARVMEPAVNANIPILFHSDGKIDDIMDDLIEMGVSCITPLDPYSIDYREYKKRYGSMVCLQGNIDLEFPLSKGTPFDVDKDVKEHMDVLKPGYGYVSSSSHSIVNYMPYENFVTYINAVHKYGKY